MTLAAPAISAGFSTASVTVAVPAIDPATALRRASTGSDSTWQASKACTFATPRSMNTSSGRYRSARHSPIDRVRRDHPADVGVPAERFPELRPAFAVGGDQQHHASAAVELAGVQREQRSVRRDLERFDPGAGTTAFVVPLGSPAYLAVRLLDRQGSRRHGDQKHRLHVQGVGQPDQVLGPVDVHLAFFPAHGPRMLEPQDIGEIPFTGVWPPKLAQALHAKLPQLLGRWMSQCFHGVCSLRQEDSKEGRNDCKRGGNAREFLGEIT